MNKKQEQVIQRLKEKIGEKSFKKAQLMADSKFGQKESLKVKFYESILDGFININELNPSEDEILLIVNKIESASDEDRERVMLEVIDSTYDITNPKIKAVLRKHEREFKKILADNYTRKNNTNFKPMPK